MVRIKNRYLLINFLYPTVPTAESKELLPDIVHFHQPSSDELSIPYLLRLIRENVLELYGEYGVGAIASGLKVMYLSTATSTAIVRAPRAHFRLVWGALSFINNLPSPVNAACVVRVVRVSGTIRKAEDEVIKRAKESILKAQRATGSLDTEAGGYLENMVAHTKSLRSEGIEDEDMDDVEEEAEESEDDDPGVPVER